MIRPTNANLRPRLFACLFLLTVHLVVVGGFPVNVNTNSRDIESREGGKVLGYMYFGANSPFSAAMTLDSKEGKPTKIVVQKGKEPPGYTSLYQIPVPHANLPANSWACTMNTKNSEAILKLPGVFIPGIDPSTFTQSAFHSYVQNNQKKLNMKGYDSIRTLVYTDMHGGTGSASMLIPPGFMVLDAHGNNELGLEGDCMVPSEYAKLHLQRADWGGLKIDNLPPHKGAEVL